MKKELYDVLKDHVKNGKLDEFGVLFCIFYLISAITSSTSSLSDALKMLKNEKLLFKENDYE